MSHITNCIRREVATFRSYDGVSHFIEEETAERLASHFDTTAILEGKLSSEKVRQWLGGDVYEESYVDVVRKSVSRCLPRVNFAMAATSLALPAFPQVAPLPAGWAETLSKLVGVGIADWAISGIVAWGVGAIAFTPQPLQLDLQIGENYRRYLEQLKGPQLRFEIRRSPFSETPAGQNGVRLPNAAGGAKTPEEWRRNLEKRMQSRLKKSGLPAATRSKLKARLAQLQKPGEMSLESLLKVHSSLAATERALMRAKENAVVYRIERDRNIAKNRPWLVERVVQLRKRFEAVRGYGDPDHMRWVSIHLTTVRSQISADPQYSPRTNRVQYLKGQLDILETKIVEFERECKLKKENAPPRTEHFNRVSWGYAYSRHAVPFVRRSK